VRSESARSILVVDDDATFRARLVCAFEERGYYARGAADAEEAITSAAQDSPEVAVVDLRMPGRGGLDVVSELKRIDPTTNVVVLTGYGSIATALEAIRLGATHYLTKPADVDEILAAVDRAKMPPEKPLIVEHEVASLTRAEWEHIQRVLTDCNGNVSQTAHLLGLHRRSLQRKLAKYPVIR
jgi:two-component system response regulator RegA